VDRGFKYGELMVISSGGGSSILEQLDNMMTSVLFANGQSNRYQAKFLLNNHTKINYWTEQLKSSGPTGPYYTILVEIYEILDTWLGGWATYWQHVSPVLFPYLGDDPEIKSLETLMK